MEFDSIFQKQRLIFNIGIYLCVQQFFLDIALNYFPESKLTFFANGPNDETTKFGHNLMKYVHTYINVVKRIEVVKKMPFIIKGPCFRLQMIKIRKADSFNQIW